MHQTHYYKKLLLKDKLNHIKILRVYLSKNRFECQIAQSEFGNTDCTIYETF